MKQKTAREHLQNVLSYAFRYECEHEDTYRGGAIWTICNLCGTKWADDEGGFVPYKMPKVLKEAEDFLAETSKSQFEKEFQLQGDF